MSLYQDLILDHYQHPRCHGALPHPSGTGYGFNRSCGDKLKVDIEIRDGIMEKARFSGQGCAISQASASMLLEHLMGQPVEKVEAFTKKDLLALLGLELSPNRLKCALLSLETLRDAIRKTTGD